MSSKSEAPAAATDTLPDKNNFEAKFKELRKSQEEQYLLLSKKYKEDKDRLKSQQQKELEQYYTRQSVLNPGTKPPPPRHELISPPQRVGSYHTYHDSISRKPDFTSSRKDVPMLEESGHSGPSVPMGSSALSSLVRDRLRQKALDNINKKSHFDPMDAKDVVSRRQEDFNRWVYESGAYEPADEDEPEFSLRKAASEPNLKGRNQLKHRTHRYKPHIDRHSMHTRHYSPNETSTRHTEGYRDAISPPYRPVDKVFHPGPRGGSNTLPLFQSPSLPNINFNSSRSQVHFPSSSSALSSSLSGSNPDMKAPFDPGHPKYLDMLKTQYATNHRYLQHIMVRYGYDPKDIDSFHQRYLSKVDDSTMSDEERVKQLLESQNRLYITLADSLNLSSPFSKSYSKLHSIDSLPPSTSLMPSRSHDSLHSIKFPRKDVHFRDDNILQPHGLPMSSRLRYSSHTSDYPSLPPDLHIKDHQATRFRLKEHLREKQDASVIKGGSIDAHYRRLERDNDDKIQEETAEDVANEERKRVSREEQIYLQRSTDLTAAVKAGESTSNSSVYESSRQNGLSSKFRGSDTRLYSSSSSLHTSNPKLMGSEPRLYNSDSIGRLSDRSRERERDSERERERLHTSNPYLHGSGSRLNGSNPYLYGSNSRLHSSASRIHGSSNSLHNSNPQLHNSDSRMNSSDPRINHCSSSDEQRPNKSTRHMTGLVYDTIMLKHHCQCGGSYPLHPENSGRLQSIWARLQETGVANLCEKIRPRKATIAELQTVHSEQHTLLFGGGASSRGSSTLRCFTKLPCGGIGVDADTIWNETHTSNAARMAAGCVIELAFKVASGDLKNGFAIVRPPGHHAEAHQAMGFCYFNSVAIAAKLLCTKLAVERVMIFDWDIHHGNGTQQMFYDNDHVLYMSMHRYDDGNFFPGTGKAEECGAGIGMGTNVNIPFNGGVDPAYGDKEYLAAFRSIVLPIAKEYNPDIILVSAGFDAAEGHSPQVGGYNVSAACFAYMTKQLMELANGKLVLALEGGYHLQSLCDSAENCIRALQGASFMELSEDAKLSKPHDKAIKCIEHVVSIQGKYWSGVKRASSLISSSQSGAKRMEKEEADTVNALASLSVHVVKQNGGADSQPIKKESTSSREEEPMDEN